MFLFILSAFIVASIAGYILARALMYYAAKHTGLIVNGWSFNLTYGQKTQGILQRAVVATIGLGANSAEEAVYYATFFDNDGKRLRGENCYTLHFEAHELPPVDAFWSITAYELTDYMLVANSIRRYSIGDRTPGLRYNNDGSLDIYFQYNQPNGEYSANWLPVPATGFMLCLRAYEPKEPILKNQWKIPAITELKECV